MRADLTSPLTSPENFETLVREHQSLVFRTLTRLTGSGPHVEDLAQEVFLRLYKALPHFRGDSTLSTYLYRIIVNISQDEWKRRRRERSHLATDPTSPDEPDTWLENLPGDNLTLHTRSPEQHLTDAQLQLSVEQALAALPEIERTILVLYHQEECSYDGIASALSMPINTVRTHLHRGRKRLAAMLSLGASTPTSNLTTSTHLRPVPAGRP
jgi:RNA polymerase sigma-70 factor (ECF subfamily)